MASKKHIEFKESHLEPPKGANRLGDVPPAEVIEVSIYLKPRSTPQEDRAIGGPTKRRAALHAKRADEHKDDLRLIKEFAAENGLTVSEVELGRRLVKIKGPAAKVEAAFGTKLSLFDDGERKFRGREGALKLPDDVSPIVQAVMGLDTRPAAHPNSSPLANPSGASSFLPNAVGALYDYPAGVNGAGQCIALIELGGGFLQSDLTQSFNAMGETTPQVVWVPVDGATNGTVTGSNADGEVALDMQVSGGVAPGAKLAVYFAPNSTQGFVDAVSTAVHDTTNAPTVVSISWGSTETNYSTQFRQQMDSVFQDAITLHISVFVAVGDHLGTDGNTDGKVHVQYPASSPWSIGCGGTVISASGNSITSETVWNDGSSLWGTGGGVSTLYPVPGFQDNANVPKNVSTGLAGRGVPDVAGNGASGSGYQIVLNGSSQVWYGTSAVAPLWAGLTAIINQKVSEPIGFFLPYLYNNPGSLRDITQGNNMPPGTSLGYSAGSGWDACTGLGRPDGAALLAAFDTKPIRTTAALYSGTKCYFFAANQYIRVTRGDTGPGTVDPGYPAPISNWGWGSFGANGIDAALYSGTKYYFFVGNRYVRVTRGDTGPGTVDPGYPAPISNWGWGSFGRNGIDAALYSGTKCYFFAGDQYIRVTRGDTGPGTVNAGYPAPISNWGWGTFGANGIDAALYSGTKCYFFADGQYISVTRGDTGPGTVDAGYPAPISNWDWPQAFQQLWVEVETP